MKTTISKSIKGFSKDIQEKSGMTAAEYFKSISKFIAGQPAISTSLEEVMQAHADHIELYKTVKDTITERLNAIAGVEVQAVITKEDKEAGGEKYNCRVLQDGKEAHLVVKREGEGFAYYAAGFRVSSLDAPKKEEAPAESKGKVNETIKAAKSADKPKQKK